MNPDRGAARLPEADFRKITEIDPDTPALTFGYRDLDLERLLSRRVAPQIEAVAIADAFLAEAELGGFDLFDS